MSFEARATEEDASVATSCIMKCSLDSFINSNLSSNDVCFYHNHHMFCVAGVAQAAVSTSLRVYEVHSRDDYDAYDNGQKNSLQNSKDHLEYSRKHDRSLADLWKQARRRNNSAAEYDDERFKRMESNLTEVLTNLSSVLNQILNIVKYTKQEEFRAFNDYIPNNGDRNRQRIKRNTQDLNNTVTEKVTVENTTEITNTSGRRTMMGSPGPTNDEVRNKLFTYIDEGFNEIIYKVNSLQPIKTAFNNDVAYKIGYIVANIDTLDANMKNLKRDMESDKYGWSDNKILNLYDTIKLSSSAVSNLMDVLKNFLEGGVSGGY
ncbi:unnamed protein product [Danaus chrysippus]|uniref:(African queen) hypothetical protein n=1 Tax=Danaus chrysippus TaxID=151541 RepID=A0A8J2R1S3_9NEOP|nr:unnamed protein product [Danaus chrysippus]